MNELRRTFTLAPFTLLCIAAYAQSANFTASVTSGCSPLVVNFQDQSTGDPTSWFWDFGNGATSTLQNPSTTYFRPGTYSITLTVKNGGNSNTLTRSEYITIYDKPTVVFIASDSNGCFPLRTQFTDLSTPSSETTNSNWFWDFGDGTQSNQQNPLHAYTTAGDFTVNLKVTNDKGCYAVLSKPTYIRVAEGVASAFSTTQPVTCRPPYDISFTNNSTGPGTLSWFWDFGDGSTSTEQNPAHTYTAPGNYTVSLATASSIGCTDTLRREGALNIEDIQTRFSAPDSICTNAVISFSNTSTPSPTQSAWDFGDGSSSSDVSPTKSYATPGTYTIRLYNSYSYCTDSFSRTIRVLPRPAAKFSANTTFSCQPGLAVDFKDQSSNAVSWFWDFGDSTTSDQPNPSHTYTDYGNYTVRLVVTNTSGCTDTLTRPAYIKIARPLIRFPLLPVEGCIPYRVNFVANVTTPDAVTSYSWDFGNGITSTVPKPSYTYTTQGSYTVSLTITTSTGCTETYKVGGAVKVGRKPVIDFAALPTPVCAFQPVQFTDKTNEADSWRWFFGDGETSTDPNPWHQYADTGLFTVALAAKNNGCWDTLTLYNLIRVKPPIARFGFQTNCTNRRQFAFLDSSVGATSWFWDFGDGTTSTEQNPVHVFPSFKIYDVSLTVASDTCTHTITQKINAIHENPDFAASTTEACRTARITFSASNINRSNIVRYEWNFGNGATGNSGAPGAASFFTNSGSYTVQLITTDIYGCKDTTIKPNYIRINGPVAAFTATDLSGCKGLTTTFNDVSADDGISAIINRRWDFGDGSIQTFGPGSVQHTYNTAGGFTVKLIVTDAGGCSDSLTMANFIFTSEPKASFSSADTLSCPGSNVQFVDESTASNYTSVWDFGDGNSSTAGTPSNVYTRTGLYSVKLKIRDQYGCSDSLTRVDYINVNRPVASYTVNDSVSACTPFEVQFTNTSQYYVRSVWDLSGGVSTLQNPVRYYNAPGTYPIRLIVTSPGGCMDTTYGTVHVYDTIGSKVTYGPVDGCKPLGVSLNTFSPVPASYTWDFGDGVLITNDTTDVDHVYNFFGNFIPKVILTDPAGCIIPVSGKDTIRIIGATAKFGIDKQVFCDSGLVTFTDSTTFNDPVSIYHWDFGDGTTSDLQNPTHYYSSPGSYTPSLSVRTENACVDTFRVEPVKIIQSPLISIGGDSVLCLNDSIQHLGVFERSDTSAVQWSWQFPNGNVSNLQIPAFQQYTTAGKFIVTAIATNSTGCKDTAAKNILIHPLPVVDMPSTLTMQVGFPITIPASYTSNVTAWTWSPATGLNCSDCPQPIINPKFDTRYTVSFTDSNGCKNTGEVQIVVICKNANVYVPNTFSPNGDGSNDVFYVRGKGLDRVKSLRIYNRWGQIVFEQQNFPVNDPLYGWNGTYRGNKPVPDVYVYQVEVFCDNSQIIHFEGNVALIQ